MNALPFGKVTLHSQKPMDSAYPKILNTLGDHIRKRRLDLKLSQKAVAGRLEVDDMTIVCWEKNRNTPCISQIPKIIEFLGYIPYNSKDCTDLKDKLQYFRKLAGLNQEKLAALLQVDESTVASWERGEHKPIKKMLDKLEGFFKSCSLQT